MKSNEIVQEGPWDFAKKVAAGVGGAVTAGQSFKGGYNREAGQQEINRVAGMAAPQWFKAQQGYTAQNIQPNQMVPYIEAWARDWFDTPNLPGYKQVTKEPQVSDQGAKKYLQYAAAMQLNPVAPQPGQQQQQQQQSQQAQQPQQAAQQPQQAQQAAQPTQQSAPAQQQPQANPAHAIFQDPAKFTAEFNKYIQSTGLNQLVNFKLKDVLKDMWMRSGGTRVESKNNKGKRV
jgi:DNA primase